MFERDEVTYSWPAVEADKENFPNVKTSANYLLNHYDDFYLAREGPNVRDKLMIYVVGGFERMINISQDRWTMVTLVLMRCS